MRFSPQDFIKATGAVILQKGSEHFCEGISTDSRFLKNGDLFFALKGPHFDGHHFLNGVFQKGGWGVVVERETVLPKEKGWIFQVPDVLKALGDATAWWRRQFNIPMVAITGSNGKTTTKEMLAAILATRFEILKTEGNFNNLIGLPLTLSRLNAAHQAAVLEMGMNSPGEIARLTEIAAPTVGVITNAAAAHLEKLGNVEAVAKAKCELFDNLAPDGTAIFAGEDPYLAPLAAKFLGKKLSFGIDGDCDVTFLHMEGNGFEAMVLTFNLCGEIIKAKVGTAGIHNVLNAMAAATAAKVLGFSRQEIVAGLEKFEPVKMRFQQLQLANGVRLVNDAYNANPVSMEAAFKTVGRAQRAGRFIAVLGDMKELGESSAKLHEEVGEKAVENGVDRFFLIGEYAASISKGAQRKGLDPKWITVGKSQEELAALITEEIETGDVVLVKASRGMELEKVVDILKEKFDV